MIVKRKIDRLLLFKCHEITIYCASHVVLKTLESVTIRAKAEMSMRKEQDKVKLGWVSGYSCVEENRRQGLEPKSVAWNRQ